MPSEQVQLRKTSLTVFRKIFGSRVRKENTTLYNICYNTWLLNKISFFEGLNIFVQAFGNTEKPIDYGVLASNEKIRKTIANDKMRQLETKILYE